MRYVPWFAQRAKQKIKKLIEKESRLQKNNIFPRQMPLCRISGNNWNVNQGPFISSEKVFETKWKHEQKIENVCFPKEEDLGLEMNIRTGNSYNCSTCVLHEELLPFLNEKHVQVSPICPQRNKSEHECCRSFFGCLFHEITEFGVTQTRNNTSTNVFGFLLSTLGRVPPLKQSK